MTPLLFVSSILANYESKLYYSLMFTVNNLRQIRAQKGYTQQALSDRVGISRQAYTAIEAGRSIPSTDVAMKIARALDITVEDIFSLEDGSEIKTYQGWLQIVCSAIPGILGSNTPNHPCRGLDRGDRGK